jgi:hypothetical protein
MKKNILLLVFITITFLKSFSQDSLKLKHTISFFGLSSLPSSITSSIGISYGFRTNLLNYINKENYEMSIVSVAKTNMKINNILGSGFIWELTSKKYNNKEKKGFFQQNSLSHGEINFTKFNGEKVKYSYWSLINYELGYDFKLFKQLSIELSGGVLWHWNKGFTDNVDPWQKRLGLKINYSFD